MSQVTYANGALNATVLSFMPLSSHNTNLSLFLASVVQYQSMNSQGLGLNSIGDSLYAIAAFTDIVSDNDVTLSAGIRKSTKSWKTPSKVSKLCNLYS